VLFFLIWIGYDVYTVVTDSQVFGFSWHVVPNVARALWALTMLVLFVSITLF
jgi:hypothetical protein